MTNALGTKALSPEYLVLRVQVKEARAALRNAEARAELMNGANADHAREVEQKSRFSSRFLTNAQVHALGRGSGHEIIYKTRCDVDGHACDHDPLEQPYSDAELRAADAAVSRAERQLVVAEKALAAAEDSASVDVAEVCKAAGVRFAWWPMKRFVDPRRYQYQGKPLTSQEVTDLGPIALKRFVNDGAIVEFSS